MVTKNFLFLRIALSLFLLALVGCQTVNHKYAQGKSEPPAKTEPPPRSQAPPVGVFLGPGAMRAYAHIGVLRVLQRAKVPIVVIGGTEWGSIIGASYSISKGANGVEWEMMKLKKEQLPSSNLLNNRPEPKDPQELFEFLNASFGRNDLDSGSIPFRCPTTDGDQIDLIGRGKAREQLVKCAVLPPLYSFYQRAGKTYVSGALSPVDWPGEFRKLGAQYLIYVDVISSGKIILKESSPELKALWLAVREISKQQHLVANLTIEVPIDMDLTDYDHRREAVAQGEQAATKYLPGLMTALGI